MIGDLICDRKDGEKYSAREFYFAVMNYRDLWPQWTDAITRAMDEGTEEDVKRELCRYIDEAGWNPQVKDYVNSVTWLEDDKERSFEVRVTFNRDREQHDGSVKAEPYTFTFWHPYEQMLGGDTEEEKRDKALTPFLTATRLADKMGWEMWMPITFEIPSVNYQWRMEPKDAESAEWLKAELAKAKTRRESFKGEVIMQPVTK